MTATGSAASETMKVLGATSCVGCKEAFPQDDLLYMRASWFCARCAKAALKPDISTNGRTVWVNVAGLCVGRFSSMAIDIHADIDTQMQGGKQCLFCKEGPDPWNPVPLRVEWDLFKEKMLELHGVKVPKSFRLRVR